MAINARLDRELERLLDEYCEQTGSSRSDVLRDALTKHLKSRKKTVTVTLYGLAADLIPDEGLLSRQSTDVKRIMKEHWRGKRAS